MQRLDSALPVHDVLLRTIKLSGQPAQPALDTHTHTQSNIAPKEVAASIAGQDVTPAGLSCLMLCQGTKGSIHLVALSPVGDQFLCEDSAPCLTGRQILIPARMADNISRPPAQG